ncbi:MAG: gliding motility-associated C-terminal domain-containing protein [Bacteroidia bacterium]|nr:gliding motility-associated C-terminal domain-containing protein [Bacteroidia bacterium]
MNICGDTLFPISSNGTGDILEIPDPDDVGGATVSNPTKNISPSENFGCLLTGETFSTWLRFPVKESGALEFYFATDDSPYPQAGFYDWTLFDLTNNTCDDIINNLIAPVRCNWNGTEKGGTGLAEPGNLPAGGDSSNFELPINVTAGDRYMICFNNYSSVSGIVPMVFGGTALLGLPDPPKVDIIADNSIICRGDTAVLTATNAPTSSKYIWNTGDTATSINVDPKSTSSFWVKAYLYNCQSLVSRDTFEVVVDQSLNSTFELKSSSVCVNEIINVDYKGNASEKADYFWDFGDASILNVSSKGSYKISYSLAGSDKISLYVKDGNCISTLTSKDISIASIPEAYFKIVPQSATISDPVISFRNESKGANADIIWDFGDSTAAYLNNPFHTYRSAGTFSVKLKVFDIAGCSDSLIKTVEIRPNIKFFVPNAFTPNNDGFNDAFYGMGEGIKEYNLYIYDIWGLMIFHSSDPNIHWDGNVNGIPAKGGLYVYLFKLEDYDGVKHNFLDYLTLIR